MSYIRPSYFDLLAFLSYPAPIKSCPVTLDLAFVVDASNEVSRANFQLEKAFVKAVSSKFTITKYQSRIGLITVHQPAFTENEVQTFQFIIWYVWLLILCMWINSSCEKHFCGSIHKCANFENASRFPSERFGVHCTKLPHYIDIIWFWSGIRRLFFWRCIKHDILISPTACLFFLTLIKIYLLISGYSAYLISLSFLFDCLSSHLLNILI